jgi:hypothetical protein
MMFLDEDGMVATDGDAVPVESRLRLPERIVVDLQRPGDPTDPVEKFLLRMRDALETRRQYRDLHGSL